MLVVAPTLLQSVRSFRRPAKEQRTVGVRDTSRNRHLLVRVPQDCVAHRAFIDWKVALKLQW